MKGRILLTNQLFSMDYIKESKERTVVSDHMWFTHEKAFNKTTLLHRFITTLAYSKKHNITRFWVGDSSKTGPFTRACKHLKTKGVKEICIFDPIDKPLVQSIKNICKRQGLKLTIEDTPAFMETHSDLVSFLDQNPPSKKKGIHKYSHTTFYKWQRNRLDILMVGNNSKRKPVGGKLTYDVQNRESFPKGMNTDPTHIKPLPLPSGVSGSDLKELINYIHKEFKHNPGSLPIIKLGEGGSGKEELSDDNNRSVFMYPMDHSQAIKRLKQFIKKSLPTFGKYEDAINPNIPYGYHSVLSSCLNNGLLTPKEVYHEIQVVIKKIGSEKLKGSILASIEGFVRQVFGWRSYCRLVYREEREVMMRSNHLQHTKRLPRSWFTDKQITTKIPWLDSMFNDAYKRSYAHHIVRLMVFSQWFLLMRIHPRDVLDWFWSVVSIDAYEWVMVPNVLGMGQYADGGIMMTRPYVSSSTYLEKMSRKTLDGNTIMGNGKQTKEYPWQEIWRALYYDFLMNQEKRLGKMYAYASSYARLKKISDTQKKEWKSISKKYRKL
jgi:deoxyribodipyrimidine photolyase-related protein